MNASESVSASPCPCCVSASLLITFLSLFFVVSILNQAAEYVTSSSSMAKRALSVITKICHVIIVVIAIGLGTLHTNPSLRQLVFYKFAMKMLASDNPHLDEPRCAQVANISGRVLEIGPGPGTNFRCWSNNKDIVEWVGVEPNKHFEEQLQLEKAKRNVTFPISTIWLNSEENLDIEPGSFDYVVGTHVLCSVTDIFMVLKQVRRALKPGGQYVFVEHVAAEKEKDPSTYYMQILMQPFINIIGNGCLFKDTWNYLNSQTGLPGFDVKLEHRLLALPIPALNPHIFGVATKQK